MYGERKVAYRIWWGDLREGGHLIDPGINGRIILKWILEKWVILDAQLQTLCCVL